MSFTCDRCGYTTERKVNFQKHLNRKTPCKRRPVIEGYELETKVVNGQVKIRRLGTKTKFALASGKTGKRLLAEAKRYEEKEMKHALNEWQTKMSQNFTGIVNNRKQALPPKAIRDILKGLDLKTAIQAREQQIFKGTARIGNKSFNWTAENSDEKIGIVPYLQQIKAPTMDRLAKDIAKIGAIKTRFVLLVEYQRGGDDDIEYFTAYHGTKYDIIMNHDAIQQFTQDKFMRIPEIAEIFVAKGSGWRFSRVIQLIIQVDSYRPFVGGTFIETPKALANKKCIINVDNKDTKTMKGDNRCFLWSVLAGFSPPATRKDLHRISKYIGKEHLINMSGLEYPMAVTKSNFQKFEKQNPEICLSVFSYEEHLTPIYIDGLNPNGVKIDLLCLHSNEKTHYVLISNISRLLSSNTKHKSGVQVCRRCLYTSHDAVLFTNHARDCTGLSRGNASPVRMPIKGKDDITCRFKAIEKQMPAPWCVYADFEAMNCPIPEVKSSLSDSLSGEAKKTAKKTGKKGVTTHTSEHKPLSARYLITQRINGVVSVYYQDTYIGSDCALWLINSLNGHLADFRK